MYLFPDERSSDDQLEKSRSELESFYEKTVLPNFSEREPLPLKKQISHSASKDLKKMGSVRNTDKLTLLFGTEKAMEKNKLVLGKNTTNKVTTTRYSLLTWAPKSLFFQFRRVANVYFLIITILTSMSFSPKQPGPMIGTFVFVLFFTMLKEAYEDYQRYKNDKDVNRKISMIMNLHDKKRNFIPQKWKDIQLGDLIKVKKNEEIPADMLLMKSAKSSGIVFLDTMNLDGETNLKERIAPSETNELQEDDVKFLMAKLVYDKPNPNLESWDANVLFSSKNNILNVGGKQLLLRGCYLRNTEFCYGLVVYTGHHTKIMMNARHPPTKMSRVLKKMNEFLYSVFFFQLAVIITCASLSLNWNSNNSESHYYLHGESEPGVSDFFLQMLTYWVAYSHLIPISLYVALELLKLAMGILINHDTALVDPELQIPAKARTSDLIEELGQVKENIFLSSFQVEFIFSDKTGTLTCNKMEFKQCSISNIFYGDPIREVEGMNSSRFEYASDFMQKFRNNRQSKCIHNFFTLISVCHTVVPDIDHDNQVIHYQASSPDELALVLGAKSMGYIFKAKTNNTIKIANIYGEVQIYEVLNELGFDNDRKRMSLVVRLKGSEVIQLFTKGADSSMLPCLILSPKEKELINDHLYKFAIQGLRTLVMGKKTLTQNQYEEWNTRFQEVSTSSDKFKDLKLAELYSEMENKLEYVGASAIEDKLQEGVPETIATILKTHIKLWVLTGDKQETAIEIGKSCSLIKDNMSIIILASDNEVEFINKVQNEIDKRNVKLEEGKLVRKFTYPFGMYDEETQKNINQEQIALVIDGKTLAFALADRDVASKFFTLGYLASSVICCRVSPKQKSEVVALAKEKGNWITLAIGDGANDVPMIMEGHIGVGIQGKEGTQAVRASDYSIGQFRFLKKLLLVHGRWGYRRISWFICYYFYKNIILVFTELSFVFVNGFSGQIYFADWLPMMFNAFFTSWPCLFTYSMEQDVNVENSFRFPILYRAGQLHKYFNLKHFWEWILLALIHGTICFFTAEYGFCGPTDQTGKTKDHWYTSTISFSLVIHIVTYKLYLESNFWTWLCIGIGIGSLSVYYLVLLVFSTNYIARIFQPELIQLFFDIFTDAKAYIAIIVIPVFALLPDLSLHIIKRIFFPTPTDIIMKSQKYSSHDAGSFQMPQKQKSTKKYVDKTPKSNSSIEDSMRFSMLRKEGSNFEDQKSPHLQNWVQENPKEDSSNKLPSSIKNPNMEESVLNASNFQPGNETPYFFPSVEYDKDNSIENSSERKEEYIPPKQIHKFKRRVQNLHSYATPQPLSPKTFTEKSESDNSEKIVPHLKVYPKDLQTENTPTPRRPSKLKSQKDDDYYNANKEKEIISKRRLEPIKYPKEEIPLELPRNEGDFFEMMDVEKLKMAVEKKRNLMKIHNELYEKDHSKEERKIEPSEMPGIPQTEKQEIEESPKENKSKLGSKIVEKNSSKGKFTVEMIRASKDDDLSVSYRSKLSLFEQLKKDKGGSQHTNESED